MERGKVCVPTSLSNKRAPIYQEQRTPKVAESNEGRESLPL